MLRLLGSSFSPLTTLIRQPYVIRYTLKRSPFDKTTYN